MNADGWKIQTLDLKDPLPDIPRPDPGAGIHLQIWWKSLPLGQLWLSNDRLPMNRNELTAAVAEAVAPAVGDFLLPHGFRAALPVMGPNPARDEPADPQQAATLPSPLAALEKSLISDPAPVTISVIICTRDRPDELHRALLHLSQLDPPATEILVVDNAPSARTQTVTENFPSVRYLPEPTPGLSRARNTGLRHATGELIAWTDDDTLAHPGWIGAIRNAFADQEISALTGLVLPGALATAAQVHFERDFGGFNRGFRTFTFDHRFFSEMQERGVPAWLAGAGANMAFRREVFAAHGNFDERLGAGAAGCSEDSEYWYRLLAAGKKLRYEPRAVVYHVHRSTDDDFRQQMRAYMRGHVAALLYQFQRHRHRGNLRRLFLSLPRYYWGMARGRLAGGERGTLTSEIRGGLEGIVYFFLHRRASRES